MTRDEAKKLAKKQLSHKRYEHTCNVEKMAVKLAKKYGADPEKAALAALLHDIAKELPKEEMLQIFRENAIIAGNAAERLPQVWHGPCAAILARTKYGVEDEEILSAVSCHTTGKPGMSKMDKIIYLADMTSAERDYPEVKELRALAVHDLDEAVLTALAYSIDWVKQTGRPLDTETCAAYEDMKRVLAKEHL